MEPQEKLQAAREAHEHVNAAYRLLLLAVLPHEEDRLTRMFERLEDVVEAAISRLALEIAEAGAAERTSQATE